MSNTERYTPGSHEEEVQRLILEQERHEVVQELINSLPEDEPDKEIIQEILKFATEFTDKDRMPIQRYIFFDSNTGSYYSKIEVRYTNSRWLQTDYRIEVGVINWIKAKQYYEEFFEKKMNEIDENR